MKRIPNILTLFRIITIPILLYILSLNTNSFNKIAFYIYFFSAITDWLDGYIARKYQAISPLGMFLDPLADKLLVLASLSVLLFLHRVNLWLVIISLLRELSITGLRGIAADQRIKIPSSSGGKIKTSFQLAAIGFMIEANSVVPWPNVESLDSILLGNILLFISLAFSVWSAVEYIVNFSKKYKW